MELDLQTDRLLTPEEACVRLRTSYDTLIRWNRQGKIKLLKIGGRWRITERELERFVREGGR